MFHQPKKNPFLAYFLIAVGSVLTTGAIFIAILSQQHPPPRSPPPKPKTPKIRIVTRQTPILDIDALNVPPGNYQAFPIRVQQEALNPVLYLEFFVRAGRNILVLVANDIGFQNWIADVDAQKLYISGLVAADRTTVYLPGPGLYYLVLPTAFLGSPVNPCR